VYAAETNVVLARRLWPRSIVQPPLTQADLAEAVLEPREGGRWYERDVDGSECDWGTVLTFQPPERLVVTWQINSHLQYDPDRPRASEVEVLFTEKDGQR